MIKDKALIVAYDGLGNSGVPNVIYQTITALKDDYVFDVIVFNSNSYYRQKLSEQGLNSIKYYLFEENKPTSLIGKLIYYTFKKNKINYKKSLQIISGDNYKVIHSFKEFDSWPFLKAAKKCGIQNRIIHTNINHKANTNIIGKILDIKNKMLSIKYSTKLVGVSYLACGNAFGNRKYDVIYNGYDEERFNTNYKKNNTNKMVLSHISTFSTNKNQLFSIEIAKELKDLKLDFHLNLIGREVENGYLSKMEQLIKKLDLKNYVSIVRADDVSNYIKNSSYTLLPSFYEGAPIISIESQACGVKMFASDSVSCEMDVGGIHFLDLKLGAKKWAETIIRTFQKDSTYINKYDLNKFSQQSFQNNIKSLYKTK